MPQTDSKVKWCLNKAKKEIAQGLKHRGLIETTPDTEEAKKHIIKAEHNFKAVLLLEKNKFSDWSTSAVFYTIYHCFLAILAKEGYESRNQTCTTALIQYLKVTSRINISNEIIEALQTAEQNQSHESNVIELRENFQYGTETSIKDELLKKLKDLCKQALEETKNEIYK
jgi:uncharacterized protein (UPF0332 family)